MTAAAPAMEPATMAKRRPNGADANQSADSSSEKMTTKIEKGLLKKARIVAITRGIDLFEYLDSVLRPTVEKDHKDAMSQ